ncbi:translation initiation factor 2 [Actinoplanes solisilvae]|uniref:translation initiation factor 2 n=1 Tax=Actinoplanes solisilvae TaxID=2486853 RepID=UPI00196AAF60|nr:translation initiation factor 2 [Actinoplanes solisilvae]
MPEHYVPSDAELPAPSSPVALLGFVAGTGERVLWSGRSAVAEYAFDEPASLPRWTLPEETEIVVTDERVIYRGPGAHDTGELRWHWPQHLRVQPGGRDAGRQATVTQIQLVCAGPQGSFPALVLAGGDLATVRDADRLANTLRQAIARYRVENAGRLGIPAPQARMLSRLVIGPEFSNYQGGEGQTVSLIGAVSIDDHATHAAPVRVQAQAPAIEPRPGYAPIAGSPAVVSAENRTAVIPAETRAAVAAESHPAAAEGRSPGAGFSAVAAEGRSPGVGSPAVAAEGRSPGVDFSAVAAKRRSSAASDGWSARPADDATLHGRDDLDARAADLAARVASLVADGAVALGGRQTAEPESQANLSSYLDVPPASAPRPRDAADDAPPSHGGNRAESVRRTAARLAGNAARSRSSAPRQDGEIGSHRRA